MTNTCATMVQMIYNGEVIQNGGSPSMTSRMVPPPIATAKPQTKPPNQSSCLAAACRIPEIAKANVPRISMIV